MTQEHFGFKKVSAKWVAKELNMGQQNAKKLCFKHLKLHPEEWSNLIAICEETWTHHYTLVKNRVPRHSKQLSSPTPKKQAFWDTFTVIHISFLPSETNMTTKYQPLCKDMCTKLHSQEEVNFSVKRSDSSTRQCHHMLPWRIINRDRCKSSSLEWIWKVLSPNFNQVSGYLNGVFHGFRQFHQMNSAKVPWKRPCHLLPNFYLVTIHNLPTLFNDNLCSWNSIIKYPKNK